ncbi:MrcB family domain-containing protein [Microvirga sp. VF16]|uniref:MrcB family domain-containing protein n=1 Tax=Microvirga sp. VF16 TaxID=2807101 RepID=UPI00193E01B1|nr:DUF3578 domain-containing protein [Microvirga sp. VF16]QRM36056.1 EVE domain-containing protein [Microvirga sp. VF16]
MLEQLPVRRKELFGGHDDLKALMTRIRTGLEQLPAVASRLHVRVSWSLGAGNWARVPWIALMDQRETNSTQRGIYCVFLFPEDMSGVYLALNQGVTEVIQREGRAQGRRSLSQRRAGLRASLDLLRKAEFRLDDDIDLRTEGDLGLDYESSTIAYKFYPKGHVPDDDVLNADLDAVLQGYEISLAQNTQELPSAKQSWIFQGNPKLFDMDGAIKSLTEVTWTVPEKGKRPNIGDSAFLWRAGRDAGIIATATVISEASQIENGPEELPYLIDTDRFAGPKLRVRIRIDQRLSTTLLRSTIAAEPRLSDLMILRFANYSTFSLPQNHAEALRELLVESLQQAAVSSHPNQRVWLYAPGEGADHWDEFYESGLMGIGWDELGDLSRFGSIDDLMTAMQEVYGDSTRRQNNARTCFDFVSTMRPGDLVFAKRGRTTIVGHGAVVGEFEYHPERADLRNVRAVHWQSRGEWSTATSLPIKTLTDLTNAPELVEALKQLVSLSKIEVRKPADERVLEPFTIDQAMDGIFMPRSEFINALEVWRSKKNLILQGRPGVGKSFIAKRMAYTLMGHRDPSRLRTVQFHQS